MMPSVRYAAMRVVLAMATGVGANSGGISGRSQVGCGVGPNDDTVTFRVTDCAGNVTDVTRDVLVL